MRSGAAALVAIAALALASCGSSKPAYCTARTNLENSVKGLSNLSISSGVSGLETQLKQIVSDAAALAAQAKSDFPSQTSAITSSVDSLSGAVKSLPSNPSPGQIAAIAGDASNVVSSVKSFFDATSSKCG